MISSKPARMPKFAVRVCGSRSANLTVRLVVGSGAARHEIVFEDPDPRPPPARRHVDLLRSGDSKGKSLASGGSPQTSDTFTPR